MHDDLCNAVIAAYPAVGWFALADAIKLAQRIHKVVTAYQNDKDENKEALVEIAKEAASFLRQHTQPVNPGAAGQLQTCLTALEMEI